MHTARLGRCLAAGNENAWAKGTASSDEVEDYMSDSFLLASPASENAKGSRKRKSADDKKSSVPPGVSASAGAANLRREGLQRQLDVSNKGFQMLKNMGFDGVGGLGKTRQGLSEPLPLNLKLDRAGLGVKSKEAIAAERHAVQVVDVSARQEDFLKSKQSRFVASKLQRQVLAARRIVQSLDDEQGVTENNLLSSDFAELSDEETTTSARKLSANSSAAATSAVDKVATLEKQFSELLSYLRITHHYCFFCATHYDSQAEMEANCPGEDEDLH